MAVGSKGGFIVSVSVNRGGDIKYFKLNLIFVVVFEGNYCIVLLIQ